MIYSSAFVAEARRLHKAGWAVQEIRQLLEREHGRRPSWITVKRWVDPTYAEHRRLLDRQSRRKAHRRLHGVRPKVSEDYRLEQLARMRQERIPLPSLCRVARVLWGDEWTEDRLRRALDDQQAAA